MKTKQEIFDTVLNSIREQGVKSLRGMNQCCYFDKQTKHKCGIGQLLTDEQAENWEYNLKIGFISTGIKDVTQVTQDLTENEIPTDAEFLTDLQKAHDDADYEDFIPDFNQNMNRVAIKYGLEYTS